MRHQCLELATNYYKQSDLLTMRFMGKRNEPGLPKINLKNYFLSFLQLFFFEATCRPLALNPNNEGGKKMLAELLK